MGNELDRDEYRVTKLCTDRNSSRHLACKSISKKKLRTAVNIEDVRLPLHSTTAAAYDCQKCRRLKNPSLDCARGGDSSKAAPNWISGGELWVLDFACARVSLKSYWSSVATETSPNTVMMQLLNFD